MADTSLPSGQLLAAKSYHDLSLDAQMGGDEQDMPAY
jgi:hypothetical protein